MTLEDLIREFLNPTNAYQALTIERVLLSLIVTFGVTLFIFYMYRKTFRGVLYTRNFNVGLVLTGLVVNLVVLPISSNIALSLGMVGALSIVRFRTAIKDPADIVFTFWAIAVGIISGAGLYMIAIVGSPVIGLFMFVLSRANFRTNDPYLLVINYSNEAETAVQEAIPKHKLRSRTVNPAGIELILEVRMKARDASQVDELLKIKGVKNAALVGYTADVA
ncbi:DUF4956 domain-containing protein [Candidatus Bathyarchaeota archaeon]|jgi:uncharacterized membrane protein YhiD involved in acid resistance|nr:DUF4956 domain-containing protein [Candidatus Bathyarchaeota archaeon]